MEIWKVNKGWKEFTKQRTDLTEEEKTRKINDARWDAVKDTIESFVFEIILGIIFLFIVWLFTGAFK